MKITIRLRPDRDNDIRDWYQSLARGDRSRVIRDVLKEFINHKKSVGQKYSFDTGNELADKGETDIDIKIDEADKYSKDVIDRKLDKLLDKI